MKKLLALALVFLAAPVRAGIYYDLRQDTSSATLRYVGAIKGYSTSMGATPTINLNASSGTATIDTILTKDPWVDVRYYGASTASTDNTAAFLLATTSNKRIYIPAGTWLGYLAVTDSMTITGAGAGVTIIKQVAGNNSNVLSQQGNTVTNLTVSDMSFDGNVANNPSGDNGISLVGAYHVRILRTSAYNNKLKGYAISAACDDIVIDSNEAYLNQQDGFTWASDTIASGKNCRNVTASNNFSHDNTLYGFGLVTPSAGYLPVANPTLINNRIVNNGSYGIEIFTATDAKIIGNTIEGSGNHGIDLGGVGFADTGTVIIGNHIKNQTLAGTRGIQLSNSNGAYVAGNDIFDDRTSSVNWIGIGFNAGSSNTVVNNNLTRLNQAMDTSGLAGNNNVVENNPGYTADLKQGALTMPGSITLTAGGVSAATAAFSGAVSAGQISATYGVASATAAFTGAVSVGQISATYGVAAATGAFTGTVSAARYTATYGLSAATAAFTGAVSAGQLSTTYGLSAATAAFTGAVSVGQISATYGVAAATGNYSGAVNAASLTVPSAAVISSTGMVLAGVFNFTGTKANFSLVITTQATAGAGALNFVNCANSSLYVMWGGCVCTGGTALASFVSNAGTFGAGGYAVPGTAMAQSWICQATGTVGANCGAYVACGTLSP